MTNNSEDWKKGRVFFSFNKDDNLIRDDAFQVPEKQPVIADIRFFDDCQGIIEEVSVAVHGVVLNNSHVGFMITNAFGTREFRVNKKNVDYLTIKQDNKTFTAKFWIDQKGKLRSKLGGKNGEAKS